MIGIDFLFQETLCIIKIKKENRNKRKKQTPHWGLQLADIRPPFSFLCSCSDAKDGRRIHGIH
jgi:hypothetical protein